MISLTDILGAISDDKSLMLFNTIAVSYPENDTEMILVKLKLTKKQYYSRMSELVKANLINRRTGKYFLTSLGKIVYTAQTIIAKALHDYWRLKAIDELERRSCCFSHSTSDFASHTNIRGAKPAT